eukprot:5201052-Pleurochrysis_carterae.AAC.3
MGGRRWGGGSAIGQEGSELGRQEAGQGRCDGPHPSPSERTINENVPLIKPGTLPPPVCRGAHKATETDRASSQRGATRLDVELEGVDALRGRFGATVLVNGPAIAVRSQPRVELISRESAHQRKHARDPVRRDRDFERKRH